MKNSLKHKVKFQTKEHPDVDVYTRKIVDGVHAIIISFNERFSVFGYGGGVHENGTPSESIIFGQDDEIILEVEFMGVGGMILGSISKSTFVGTFVTSEKWSKVWKDF